MNEYEATNRYEATNEYEARDGSTTEHLPSAPPSPAETSIRRTPRVRTVVLGLVMLTLSVLSLVSLLTDVRLDGGVVALGLLLGAGAALVAGGIAAAVREAKGGPGAVR